VDNDLPLPAAFGNHEGVDEAHVCVEGIQGQPRVTDIDLDYRDIRPDEVDASDDAVRSGRSVGLNAGPCCPYSGSTPRERLPESNVFGVVRV
jgi:hypothetical protein